MTKQPKVNYWLFQCSPKVFDLQAALKNDVLETFPVKAHRNKITQGDSVILWQTGKNAGCYALAEVRSDVDYWPVGEDQMAFYKKAPGKDVSVRLKIEYNLWNKPITKKILPDNKSFARFYAGLPGTNYKATFRQYKEIENLIEQFDLVNEPEVPYLPAKAINYALNTILFGPPGTGKTYHTINYALGIIESRSLHELSLEPRSQLRKRFTKYSENGQIVFITFHQSFAYEDFVEGIKPLTKRKKISYSIEDGVFKQLCLNAQKARKKNKDQPKKYVLIIDEINRGNIAGIFGDTISLIDTDKREGQKESLKITLPYSKTFFNVPPNVYILGTMNTADRSVEAMDIALRRRFTFVEMEPDPMIISRLAKSPVTAGVDLEKLLSTINYRIELLLNKDYRIGHSYFLNVRTLADLRRVFDIEIIPLLQEYFFGDFAKIGLVLGRDFIIPKNNGSPANFANFEHEYLQDYSQNQVYQFRPINELDEQSFIRIYDRDWGKEVL